MSQKQFASDPQPPDFRTALRFWVKLGFISFGGPAGQIAIMHQELVENRRWLSERTFLHALNFCMLLPGPEAQQLAIYSGWLMHRARGGLAAGILFVLPSALLLWALSVAYVSFGNVPAVMAVLWGLKAAVLAIVFAALVRISTRALKTPFLWVIAALAWAGLQFGHLPYPAIIGVALALGYFLSRFFPVASESEPYEQPHLIGQKRGLKRAATILIVGLIVWWGPVLALAAWLGQGHVAVQQGVFFSKTAMVTFGGAYAVLPYVSQHAVQSAWLNPTQMWDGLALAETTPGPLIMVLQFVGFIGAWNSPGTLPPMLAATVGAAVTTWTTFVPCFLWIFLGAPYVEIIRANRHLSGALSTVSAAVAGLILTLAVSLAANVIVPSPGRVDTPALVLALVGFAALVRFKWPLPALVGGFALLGWLLKSTVLSNAH